MEDMGIYPMLSIPPWSLMGAVKVSVGLAALDSFRALAESQALGGFERTLVTDTLMRGTSMRTHP